MKLGYARVSTDEQNLSQQKDAPKEAGCDKIFHDQVSGPKAERPGLQEAKAYVRDGDTLVVWRLDRALAALRDLLAGGPKSSNHIFTQAKAAGLSEPTVRRARKRLGVVSRRPPGESQWVWELPGRK